MDTTRRKRITPETQWNHPACYHCQQYSIEVNRTNAGSKLYHELKALYPKRSSVTLLKDLQATIEAKVVACEHLAAEDGALQHLTPAERRQAGIRASIRVWTRVKAVYNDEGVLVANGSAWTDEGVYVQ